MIQLFQESHHRSFPYTPINKSKCFYQAFSMGIITFIWFKKQPAGNLWVFLCKLYTHLTDKGKFLLIIIEKFVIHKFFILQ